MRNEDTLRTLQILRTSHHGAPYARGSQGTGSAEVGTSLGVSWLPDWGFTGSEQGSKKPQRSFNRPGTPRPSSVEHLQSQATARGAAKENCSLEGELSTEA